MDVAVNIMEVRRRFYFVLHVWVRRVPHLVAIDAHLIEDRPIDWDAVLIN